MINLLPPKQLVAMRIARNNTVLWRYNKLVLLGSVLLLVFISGAHYFLATQKKKVDQVVTLDQKRIEELQPYQERAEDLSSTITTVSALLSTDIHFSELLTTIGGVIPSGAALTGLDLSVNDLTAPLVVSAEVDTEERAAVLLNNLLASPLTESASVQSLKEITDKKNSESDSSAPLAEGSVAPAPKKQSSYRFIVILNVYLQTKSEKSS